MDMAGLRTSIEPLHLPLRHEVSPAPALKLPSHGGDPVAAVSQLPLASGGKQAAAIASHALHCFALQQQHANASAIEKANANANASASKCCCCFLAAGTGELLLLLLLSVAVAASASVPLLPCTFPCFPHLAFHVLLSVCRSRLPLSLLPAPHTLAQSTPPS